MSQTHPNASATPKVPIIAVFGSNDEDTPAKEIGMEIGKRGYIVLTGGAGPAGDAVKNNALAGVDCAATGTSIAPWVGVPKASDELQARYDLHRTYVLKSSLGNERNYVEAVLCNVAIAIAGGDGTASEVAFCLSIGRPTVLVGDWSEFLPIEASHANKVENLVAAIRRRVLLKSDGTPRVFDSELRERIEQAAAALVSQALPENFHPSDAMASDIVAEAEKAIGGQVQHAFPDLRVLSAEREPYLDWLSTVEAARHIM